MLCLPAHITSHTIIIPVSTLLSSQTGFKAWFYGGWVHENRLKTQLDTHTALQRDRDTHQPPRHERLLVALYICTHDNIKSNHHLAHFSWKEAKATIQSRHTYFYYYGNSYYQHCYYYCRRTHLSSPVLSLPIIPVYIPIYPYIMSVLLFFILKAVNAFEV